MSEEPVNCSRTKRKKNLRGRGRNKAKPVSGRISVRAKARVRQFCLGNEWGSGSGSGSGSSHRNRLGCLPDNCEMQTTTSEWPKKKGSPCGAWLIYGSRSRCRPIVRWATGSLGPALCFLALTAEQPFWHLNHDLGKSAPGSRKEPFGLRGVVVATKEIRGKVMSQVSTNPVRFPPLEATIWASPTLDH